MKTSKINAIQSRGSWEHEKHGTFYTHVFTFEDGVTLMANSKGAESIHKVGDVVEYEITRENEQGKSGKVHKPNLQFSQQANIRPKSNDDVQVYIIRQSSLNRAIEHLTALGATQNLNKENVIKLAEFYTDWILKPKPVPKDVSKVIADSVATANSSFMRTDVKLDDNGFPF